MRNNTDIQKQIAAHAAECFPRESCGLIVKDKDLTIYVRCENIAASNEHFQIDKNEIVTIEDRYDSVEAIVHSHPNESPEPSQADVVCCEATKLPWIIVGYNPGVGGDEPTIKFRWVEPTGFELPFLGREFIHGRVDCYTIIRDYYRVELSIDIPDFIREDGWWDRGENLYLDNFEKAGFIQVQELAKHDVLLMHLVVKYEYPNHGAIYLGDGVILQHLPKRLSGREQYGGYYQRHTTHILRHKSLC